MVILKNISHTLIANLYHSGLIMQYKDTVKLHVTLMNSKFLLDDEQLEQKPRRSSNTFDATEIIKVKTLIIYLNRTI